jgi:sulfate permease, SulP family
VQATVMTVTFALTMVIALQYAVLVGVGISMILYIITQSNRVTVKRWMYEDDGRHREVDPPHDIPANEVVVLQPYGSLFFAAAPVFEEALPNAKSQSTNSVVILRLRGRTDLGSTFMDVLGRYADALASVGSKLVIISGDENIHQQLAETRVTAAVGTENIYTSDEYVGATLKIAYDDATAWIAGNKQDDSDSLTDP